jgi:DNA replication protein DnaC
MKDENGDIVYDVYVNFEGVELARKAREVMTICKCIAEKRVQRLLKSSQITDEMRSKGFKNFDTEGQPQAVTDAKARVLKYYKDFKDIRRGRNNSIAILGQPGSGKTHLLMALANTLLHFGTAVIYFSWVDGFNDLRKNMDNLDDMIKRLQTVEVLFIDDMFKGRKELTDFQRETLFAIINYRYLNHLPVLISSERDTDQMCEIDEAIGSRIHEMCRNHIIVMQGKELNYRLKGETA